MSSTAAGRTLDVSALLDRGMTPFHRRLLLISCLVTFFDGLDYSLISFTLPYLRDEMALTDEMSGFVSSAAFAGQMVGSLVGSFIADIAGRRPVILWCTILGAVLTFMTGFAGTPVMLIVLRFLGGLAIGGLLAPAWSLNIESMPAGKRATAVTVIMLGFSAGSAAAGQVTNFLAPEFGWEAVLWFTYFCSSFAIYLKSAFGVLFMEELGIERTYAADLASINGLLGAIGGVVLLMYTEKRGPIWIALAPLIGIPLAVLIGSGLIDGGPMFIPVILLGGTTIGIGHAAVIAMTSFYYPSAVRSTGGGWASFMAKFAAVAAPIVGGYFFLADRQAVLNGYNFTALCLAGVVIGIVALAFFARRLLAERDAEATAAAG